jgi:uncharacterized protein involved in tolerance to divalent cations
MDKVIEYVKANHSYSVPEIISVKIDRASEDYLKWIHQSTSIDSL